MAVQLLKEGGVANTPFKSYIVDLLMELPYLEAPLGAQATCLEDGRKYVMGSDGTWKKINNGVDLYDEQVTESKIAYKAVSADKIADEAVTQRTLNADTVLPEEDQGTDVSTVTTGEKYQWNHAGGGNSLYRHEISVKETSGSSGSAHIVVMIPKNNSFLNFSEMFNYFDDDYVFPVKDTNVGFKNGFVSFWSDASSGLYGTVFSMADGTPTPYHKSYSIFVSDTVTAL